MDHSNRYGRGQAPSLLNEDTMEAMELRIRTELDSIKLEELRFQVEDENGTQVSEKLELSAATIALRFQTLSEDVKEVIRGSERARILAAKAFKTVSRLGSMGGRQQQSRLVRTLRNLAQEGALSEIQRLHQAVEAIGREYQNNSLQRTKNIRAKIEYMRVGCNRGVPYLDEVIDFCVTYKRLILASWISEFDEGGERDTASRAGSPTQKKLTRELLRKCQSAYCGQSSQWMVEAPPTQARSLG